MDEEEEGIQLPSEPQSVSNLAAQDTSPFRINHSLTPSYLPLRVVEKVLYYYTDCTYFYMYMHVSTFMQILFIGEAVQIFQNQNTSDGYPPLPSFIKGSGKYEVLVYSSMYMYRLEFCFLETVLKVLYSKRVDLCKNSGTSLNRPSEMQITSTEWQTKRH